MLNLNNRGWGLSSIFAFICVFLIAIILIAIQVTKLGMNSPKNYGQAPTTTSSPDGVNPTASPIPSPSQSPIDGSITGIENRLSSAGITYQREYYQTLIDGDSVYVSVKRLVDKNYISKLVLDDGTACTGYAQIKNQGGSFYSTPFIKCGSSYVTSGYLERFDQ